MQQLRRIPLRLLHRLPKRLPKYIIRHHPSRKPSITRNRILQFHILLPILKHRLWCTHLFSSPLLSQTLLERLRLRNSKLIIFGLVKVWRLNNKWKSYWLNENFLIRHTNNISSRSLQHLRRWNINLLLGRYIFIFRIDILSLNIRFLFDIECRFSKGASIEILGFDPLDITSITFFSIEIPGIFPVGDLDCRGTLSS